MSNTNIDGVSLPFVNSVFPRELCEWTSSKDQRVISAMTGRDDNTIIKYQISVVNS